MLSPKMGIWPLNCQRVSQEAGCGPALLQVQPALTEGLLRVRVVGAKTTGVGALQTAKKIYRGLDDGTIAGYRSIHTIHSSGSRSVRTTSRGGLARERAVHGDARGNCYRPGRCRG